MQPSASASRGTMRARSADGGRLRHDRSRTGRRWPRSATPGRVRMRSRVASIPASPRRDVAPSIRLARTRSGAEYVILRIVLVFSGQYTDAVMDTSTSELAPAKILVVDDEHLVALDLQQRLRRMGHSPVVVFSSEQAIENATSAHFDLVLMDIKLKGSVD